MSMDVDTIRADLETVCGRKGAPGGGTLREALARLDEAVKKVSLPPKLKHYLEKRSYQKALEMVDSSGIQDT